MRRIRKASTFVAVGCAVLALSLAVNAAPAVANDPTTQASQGDLLAAATTELITNLDQIGWPEESSYNFYSAAGASTTIVFGSPGQPTTYRNETRCATFVRRLLTHRFAWATTSYFTSEFGTSFPNSAVFYDRFEADRTLADDVPNIRAYELRVFPYFNLREGDLMAIKYIDAPSSDSGHMAIIGTGSHLFDDTNAEYREWAIRVMDSTSSPHGNPANPRGYPDTRFYFDDDANEWTEANGAGMGWMFIRTSRADGRIISHRWSLSSPTWYDTSTRPIVFGRIDLYA